MAGTGDQVRGHLVDRKGIHGFEEVGMCVEEEKVGQTGTLLEIKIIQTCQISVGTTPPQGDMVVQ